MAAPAAIARENGKKGGRPKGSSNKPKISDFLSDGEIRQVAREMYNQALEGDVKAQNYILDHAMGKPAQSIDHTTDGQPVQFVVPKEIAEKNSLDESSLNTEEDSS